MDPMTGIVAITARGWYDFLRAQPKVDEVNFWKPSAYRGLNAPEFSPLFFEQKAKDKAVCCFGCFAQFAGLPPWLALDAFEPSASRRAAAVAPTRPRRLRIRLSSLAHRRSA